jgi:RNA polymerase sigma factor (sigma-70 family)
MKEERLPSTCRAATGVAAAIAVTGLKMSLQTGAGNRYHTDPRRSLHSGPVSVMDDQRAINQPGDSVDSTFDLVERAKTGDSAALNELFVRYLPPLRRWASGRLPRWTRDLMDTDDLVQETVFRAVKRMDRFEARHEGALQAYLRQAVVNRIRDEVRRAKRAPGSEVLDDNAPDVAASPLEKAIGAAAAGRAPGDRRPRRDGRQLSGRGARARQTIGRRGADGRQPRTPAARRGNEGHES